MFGRRAVSGRVLSIGADRIRVGPWRGDAATAYLAPIPNGRPLRAATIRACIDEIVAEGYVHIFTAALSIEERGPFPAMGFSEREQLHLLAHEMTRLPPPPSVKLRRGRRSDRRSALAVDRAAFSQFWQLDADGLDDALHATPAVRFRVAGTSAIAGYAVTGRAGDRGYLQRLAVHPGHQGAGLGMTLVSDSLHWLHRRGVQQTIVNTQVENQRALQLYDRAGFELQANGLTVFELALP